MVGHSASAACDECRSLHDHELVHSWPRHTSAEGVATLATSRAANHLQALSPHPHGTSPAIFVQFVQPLADTGSGRLTHHVTFYQELAPNLESMVSTTLVQPPGTVFCLIYMTSLILVHFKTTKECTFGCAYWWILYIAPGWCVQQFHTYFILNSLNLIIALDSLFFHSYDFDEFWWGQTVGDTKFTYT